MSLDKVVAIRIEKDERVTVKESYNFCFVHGEGFNEAYRVTDPNGGRVTSEDKELIAQLVADFHKTHKVTPRRIEIDYDSET